MQEAEVFTRSTTVAPQPSYANIPGGYIQSDWAILNGTAPEQICLILIQLNATAAEITRSCALLKSCRL